MRHRFRTYGRWLALVAIAGASTVGLAPQAGAYTPGGAVPTINVVNCTAAGAGNVAPDPIDIPTLTFGTTGQAAGCWAIQADPGQAWENGDQVNIVVDDSTDANDASGPQVSFAAKPTVKLGSTTIPDANITITTTTSANDTLRIVVTGLSAPTFADMVITNVKYDVGFKNPPVSTAYGLVNVTATLNGTSMDVGALTGFFLGGPSNAFLSDVSLTANNPTVGIDINAFPGTAKAPISDITIKEASTSALGSGPDKKLCVLTGDFGTPNPDTVDFASANVSKTAGDATALGIAVGTNALTVTFTTPATRTAANTFKITGIEVDPATLGRILTQLTLPGDDGSCGTADDVELSPLTTAGAVVDQDRTGGSDRFQTARRIAEDQLGSTGEAVIARADDFADALAASGLAGHLHDVTTDDVPILLTNTDSIPSATLNALTDLGVGAVYIVGGTQAVSQAVETQLRNKPSSGPGAVTCPGASDPSNKCLKVVRIAGANRYATAKEVADFIGTPGTVDLDKTDGLATADALKTAFLARGDVFADALAVGPLAYQGVRTPPGCGAPPALPPCGVGDGKAMPILLTQSTSLSPEAAAALIDEGIEQVVIAGGTAAVSQAVEDAVKAMGIKVVRVGGANRQHTAALVAGMAFGPSFAWPTLKLLPSWDDGDVILATGANFPDALAAGPFGGVKMAPIVLTEDAGTIGVFTTGFLDLTSAVLIRHLHVVGQTAAVGDAAATQARNALSGTTLQP